MPPLTQLILCLCALHTGDVIAGGLERDSSSNDDLYMTLEQLSRQLILQQLTVEERIRSEGDSGLKQVRHVQEGTQTYFSDSAYGYSFAANHDHENYLRTIGMGEVEAVINGVEFRTRHNDYTLAQPSTTSTDYMATENIEFPPVPPEVLQLATVDEQITEMREWFRAFRDQNTTLRDYRKYFKPVLCYMEGMWTIVDEEIDESFDSTRHYIDAKTWYELEEKVRFFAYAGVKGTDENIAFLPRALWNVTEYGVPTFAQWNYAILCQPLADDVPLNRLRVVDDMAARMRGGMSLKEYELSHLPRWQVNSEDEPFGDGNWKARHRYLDDLMYQVPGKSGPNAYFEDYGIEEYQFMETDDTATPLNAGFYHRNYYVGAEDAMGDNTRYRGFADENLYMAMTDQPKVAGMNLTICETDEETGEQYDCRVVTQKWTYAIPLEIIYMTPLTEWNPLNLTLWTGVDYHTPTDTGGNGTPENPWNGTNSVKYYRTPSAFYDPEISNKWVLDPHGVAHDVAASGFYRILPSIEDMGRIRQRYPIAPIHEEGSQVWKQLEALRQLILDPFSYGHMMRNPIKPETVAGEDPERTIYTTGKSGAVYGEHQHKVKLTADQVRALERGLNVTVQTEEAWGHSHTMELYINEENGETWYGTCDGAGYCWDNHWHAIW